MSDSCPRCVGSCLPSRFCRRGCSRPRGGLPTATRAPSPTCSGSPYRLGTRRWKGSRPGHATVLMTDPSMTLHAAWEAEVGGRAWVDRLARGEHPRAVWTAPAGVDWAVWLAASAAATRRSGRGSLLLAPDARDVARLDAAVTALLGGGTHVVLTADLGPAARYRAFLAISRGHVDIVVGTRAAAFAPVHRLGLVAMWDDGDDLYAEQRAPYPHAREVLVLRAYDEQAGMLIGAHSRTVEAQALVESGWANELTAEREVDPSGRPAGQRDGRDRRRPGSATRWPGRRECPRRSSPLCGRRWRADPCSCTRRGTATCRPWPAPAAVPRLAASGVRARWVVRRAAPVRSVAAAAWSPRTGAVGTVLARSFGPRWSVPYGRPRSGGGASRRPWSSPRAATTSSTRSTDGPAIVVATPGAEPTAAGGYAAAVLLDTWLTLSVPGLRATEEALRRWMRVAALVRPACGGRTGGGGGRPHGAGPAGPGAVGRGGVRGARAGGTPVGPADPSRPYRDHHGTPRRTRRGHGGPRASPGRGHPGTGRRRTGCLPDRAPDRTGPRRGAVASPTAPAGSPQQPQAPPVRIQVDPTELI